VDVRPAQRDRAGGRLPDPELAPHERRARQALDDAKLSLTQYANGVLGPRMIYGTTLQVGDSATGS
jgi:hypothetical protein